MSLCAFFFPPLIFKITLKGEEAEADSLAQFNYYTAGNTGVLFLDTVN